MFIRVSRRRWRHSLADDFSAVVVESPLMDSAKDKGPIRMTARAIMALFYVVAMTSDLVAARRSHFPSLSAAVWTPGVCL
jgi:hypothetical protein